MNREDLLAYALNKHCEPIVHEILEDKEWEFIKFCCSHLNERFMKHNYTRLADEFDQFIYHIVDFRGMQITKISYDELKNFSDDFEDLYLDVGMYNDLAKKILIKAGYNILNFKGNIIDDINTETINKELISLQTILYNDGGKYKLKSDYIKRMCTARDNMRLEMSAQLKDIRNAIATEDFYNFIKNNTDILNNI
jgi:hypothetical protein